jgi:hypothetical protein
VGLFINRRIDSDENQAIRQLFPPKGGIERGSAMRTAVAFVGTPTVGGRTHFVFNWRKAKSH